MCFALSVSTIGRSIRPLVVTGMQFRSLGPYGCHECACFISLVEQRGVPLFRAQRAGTEPNTSWTTERHHVAFVSSRASSSAEAFAVLTLVETIGALLPLTTSETEGLSRDAMIASVETWMIRRLE